MALPGATPVETVLEMIYGGGPTDDQLRSLGKNVDEDDLPPGQTGDGDLIRLGRRKWEQFRQAKERRLHPWL